MLHMSSFSTSTYHMTRIFYGYGLVQFGLLGLGLVTFGYFWSLIGYVWVFLAIFGHHKMVDFRILRESSVSYPLNL